MHFKPVETHWNQFSEFSFFGILRIFRGFWGSGAGFWYHRPGLIPFFVIAKWTVLEAQEELFGAPQHATLGDV